MTVHIYVDGSGSPRGGFGWFVKETGESHYTHQNNITNNQAEYLAIISAMRHFLSKSGVDPYDVGNGHNDDVVAVVVYSDSLNTVKQLNHEYAINNAQLRELAMQAWSEMAKIGDSKLSIRWIRRSENLAGKMLGS